MASGICVFAENYNGNIESVVAELVRAAVSLKRQPARRYRLLSLPRTVIIS